MRLMKGVLTVVVALALLAAATAQTPSRPAAPDKIADPPRCPTVTVDCPAAPGPDGRITYTASVSSGDTGVTPTFKWEVSAGTIVSGQGTYSITVDVSKTGADVFTGTVDVGGYDRGCRISESCSLIVESPITPRKVDEYGVIRTGDEKQRLDTFVVELQNDPTAQAYLLCYGGRRSRAGEARRRCERARTYLISSRGIEASRVMTADGGARDALTLELWLVPTGATTPQPTPTVFTKGRAY